MQTTPAHELSTYSAVFEFCEMFPRAHSFTPHEKMRYLALRATITERAEQNAVDLKTAALQHSWQLSTWRMLRREGTRPVFSGNAGCSCRQ